ncbi:hypothetical protein ACWFR5_43145 [Streptomyces sp. NPDC055092]
MRMSRPNITGLVGTLVRLCVVGAVVAALSGTVAAAQSAPAAQSRATAAPAAPGDLIWG